MRVYFNQDDLAKYSDELLLFAYFSRRADVAQWASLSKVPEMQDAQKDCEVLKAELINRNLEVPS